MDIILTLLGILFSATFAIAGIWCLVWWSHVDMPEYEEHTCNFIVIGQAYEGTY